VRTPIAAEPLAAALDRAYQAFEDVWRPRRIEASPYSAPADVAALIAVPLRDLTDEQIGAYAGSAMLTIGSGEDYNYFVPRILELAVSAPFWIGTEPERIAERLDMAGWRAWPAEQRAAIIEVFELAHALSEREDNEAWGNALITLKETRPPGSIGYGPPRRILFVGSQDPIRSEAVKRVFAQRSDLAVKFADTDVSGPLTSEMVAWADIIFASEKYHRVRIKQRFRTALNTKRVVCLDVPKKHTSDETALVQLLQQKIGRFLPQLGGPAIK
jgi:predicted protein tyrosine phosphatase